ncbi:MAG: alanine racemase [Hyphomicrobiaceae bacterium]
MTQQKSTRHNSPTQELIERAPAHATGMVVVDLDRVASNWRALSDLVRPTECAAVVKADAYGLGADHVIPALAAAGCETFFVATLDEAIQARKLAPSATTYMLDGLAKGASEAVRKAGVIPVLSSLPEIEEWSALSATRKDRLASALHVDTGLNRLGLSASEIQALVTGQHLLDRLNVTLVMSHLACADDPAHPKNALQRDIFNQLAPMLPSTARSLAASDGLMLGKSFHYDLVRPGYALYGGQAFGGGRTPVEPVVEVYAKILQVRDVAPGQTVGYSATWTPTQASRIAVIAAGYADGLFRHLSRASENTASTHSPQPANPANVAINGELAPIVGRVSMDLVTINVTGLEKAPEPGDMVELIGPNISIEAHGGASGTIGYEVLTNLRHRFHRLYVGGDC